MSVTKVMVARWVAKCDDCGRTFGKQPRESMADHDLRTHECGVHREQHDSTGGFRGILGGWNVSCVCGERWVTENPAEQFHCPKETLAVGRD